jgi:hypothetical protein
MKESKFSEEQIVKLLQEAAAGQICQAELCRKHDINANTCFLWERKYAGMVYSGRRWLTFWPFPTLLVSAVELKSKFFTAHPPCGEV